MLKERIRLTDAAKMIGVSPGALRRERDLGRLVVSRVGGKDWVTTESIEAMFDQCQGKPKDHASTLKPAPTAQPSGSSATAIAKSALDALRASAQKQKDALKPTGPKPTDLNVVMLNTRPTS